MNAGRASRLRLSYNLAVDSETRRQDPAIAGLLLCVYNISMAETIVVNPQGLPCINIRLLQLWDGNYNDGDVSAIALSIEQFGFRGALRVWVNNTVIAGNHSLKALWSLKARGPLAEQPWPPPGIVQQDGDWFVPFLDLTDMTEDRAVAFAIADNRTAQLATADKKLLTDYLTRTLAIDPKMFQATGYDRDDLDFMLAELSDASDTTPLDEWDGETPGDAAGALKRAQGYAEKWEVKPGQLWQIGRHRLFIGSAYDEAAMEQLLDGRRPDLAHLDPPYGISIVKPRSGGGGQVGGSKPFGSLSGADRKTPTGFVHGKPSKNQLAQNPEWLRMQGDSVASVQEGGQKGNIVQSNLYPPVEGDDRPFDPALFLEAAPVVILWGANYYADKLPPSSGWIVWDKREGITRNSFADCEVAWSNQDKPARIFAHLWNGLHKGSQMGERRTHPTEKPVALFEEIGKLYAPDGLWVDYFAGSGAQFVAAERAGATCVGCEIEPLYGATILERLSRLGLTPELINRETSVKETSDGKAQDNPDGRG